MAREQEEAQEKFIDKLKEQAKNEYESINGDIKIREKHKAQMNALTKPEKIDQKK